MDGAKKIRIYNEDIAVAAKVFTINGFSAHAGQDQLLDWLKDFQTKTMQVFLVHGEFSAQDHLATLIREKFGLSVTIPEYLEEILLKPGTPIEEIKQPLTAAPKLNLSPLFADLKTKLDAVGNKMGDFQSLSASQQSEIADLLRRAALNMDEIKNKILKAIFLADLKVTRGAQYRPLQGDFLLSWRSIQMILGRLLTKYPQT